jgi:hypothetical protein
MRSTVFAFGLAGIAASVVMLAADPADAQQRRRTVVTQTQRVVPLAPPRARITVTRRSYLDAGTTVVPGDRKFTDYAIPPGYSATSFHLGPSWGYDRRPLNDPFDLPGFGAHRAGF